MGMSLVLLLWAVRFLFTALSSVHGSAGPAVSPHSTPHHYGRKRHGLLHSPPPPNTAAPYISPVAHSPTKVVAAHNGKKASSIALPPSMSFSKNHAKKWGHGSASSPSISVHKYSPRPSITPLQSPISSSTWQSWPAASPSPLIQPSQYNIPIPSPKISPLASSLKRMKTPPPSEILALPPPPPNKECTSVTCTEPLTYTAPGSPCGCVQPIQVRLRLSVALYTFFPMVSELAEEIAASVSLNRSQVRILGANAANQPVEKTIVLINLIPLGAKFNATTAYLTYEKFWNKRVFIKTSVFGAYEVLYVRYPGLPPSPPSAPSSITSIDDGPHSGHENNGRAIKPLGVDVSRRKKDRLSGSMIAVIALSSFTAFVIFVGISWLLLLKCGVCVHRPLQNPHALESPVAKPSAGAALSRTSSGTMSIGSSLLTYTGSAKTYSLNDIERATDNFDSSRILGEGGFGLVYSGILDDGTKVAVKVLKRDDQQGGREFLAEVEMLSRLHHRNLVKLIGICTEEHTSRCLIYELISNGSVESHLHGIDKERDPLDWDDRMKIALGAARGLAYLHEDSSPRVIHRDFKSSNILLEDDFTPKVSDFGLAKAALDEGGNKHISTRVMGTFGYLAPEYAMTGHLLVKSDVYSYGVVLLELLTGRNPVDLSQPPGQENLVSWARPLLTSREGLERLIDPALQSNIPLDTVAKVAAIASMCVQPEVSNRPFMGEVVQALKLVCNEFDETKGLIGSRTHSQEDLSLDIDDSKMSRISGELVEVSHDHYPIQMHGYDSNFDTKIALSTSDLVSTSAAIEGQDFGSFRRHANSGPLTTGRRRQFWQRLKGLSRGSKSDHGFAAFKLWPGSQ